MFRTPKFTRIKKLKRTPLRGDLNIPTKIIEIDHDIKNFNDLNSITELIRSHLHSDTKKLRTLIFGPSSTVELGKGRIYIYPKRLVDIKNMIEKQTRENGIYYVDKDVYGMIKNEDPSFAFTYDDFFGRDLAIKEIEEEKRLEKALRKKERWAEIDYKLKDYPTNTLGGDFYKKAASKPTTSVFDLGSMYKLTKEVEEEEEIAVKKNRGGILYMLFFVTILLLTLTGGLLAIPLSIAGITFLIYSAGKYHRGHRPPTTLSINTLTKLYGCIVVILVTTFTGALVLVPGLNVIVSFVVGLILILFIPTIGSTVLYLLNATFGYLPGSKFIFY